MMFLCPKAVKFVVAVCFYFGGRGQVSRQTNGWGRQSPQLDMIVKILFAKMFNRSGDDLRICLSENTHNIMHCHNSACDKVAKTCEITI